MKRIQYSLIFSIFAFLITMQANAQCIGDISNVSNAKCVTEYSNGTTIGPMDTVTFGSYIQSDVKGKTKEPIEWVVLEKQGDRALLLSKYILDCKSYVNYDNGYIIIAWPESMLRKWLNTEFLNTVFDNTEIAKILNPTGDMNIVSDKVFCLNKNECEKYFNFYLDRITSGTDYAKNTERDWMIGGVYTKNLEVDNNGNSSYWLRTNEGAIGAPIVDSNGSVIDEYGSTSFRIGVRPAVWVSLDIETSKQEIQTNQELKNVSKNGWDGDYYYENNNVVTNQWRQYGTEWYYCGPNGAILKNQWIDNTYYLDNNGKMLTNTITPDGQNVDATGKKYIKKPAVSIDELVNSYVHQKEDGTWENLGSPYNKYMKVDGVIVPDRNSFKEGTTWEDYYYAAYKKAEIEVFKLNNPDKTVLTEIVWCPRSIYSKGTYSKDGEPLWICREPGKMVYNALGEKRYASCSYTYDNYKKYCGGTNIAFHGWDSTNYWNPNGVQTDINSGLYTEESQIHNLIDKEYELYGGTEVIEDIKKLSKSK